MWSSELPRRAASLAAAALLSACAGVDARPAAAPAAGACPTRAGATPDRIDVFDGDPSGQVILAPDDDGAGARTYTVKDVYAQGRIVTIRCHYGRDVADVELDRPVAACRVAGDDRHPRLVCR